MYYDPGHADAYTIPQNLNYVMLGTNLVDFVVQLSAYWYSKLHAPDRTAIGFYVR